MYVLFLLLIALPAFGQTLDPGAMGRAGAHDLSIKSGSALQWNPAVFAQDKPFTVSWELPSVTASAANNTFSVDYWNNHIALDPYFDAAEKQAILNRIPGDGWRANAQLSVPTLGFTYRRFGFNASVEAAGAATAPRDFVRLALIGNEIDRNFVFGKVSNDAEVYGDYSVGFGYPFQQEFIPQLSFGIGFHFFQGFWLSKVIRSDVNLFTDSTAMHASGIIQTVTSSVGDGVGFDLGSMATLSDKWQVGLAIRQLGARVSWQVHENHQVSFYTDSTGVNMDNLNAGNATFADSVLHKEDFRYPGGEVETTMSPVIQVNGRYLPHPRWTVLGDFSARLRRSVKGPTGADVSVAGEFRALPWLALQSGVGVGNIWGPRIGVGAGLRFRHYELDAGGGWNGGVFNGARGVAVGLSQRINF